MLNKTQISVESYHKLNRANRTAFYSTMIKAQGGNNELFDLLSAHLFSYIKEDVGYVLAELKEKGLCDQFLSSEQAKGMGNDYPDFVLFKKEA
ncbi:Derepression protein [Serratia marcescens]|uniref:Derepression protein n=1 Tax=Serratia marcescens TaxID=615 RepID=UPI004045B811